MDRSLADAFNEQLQTENDANGSGSVGSAGNGLCQADKKIFHESSHAPSNTDLRNDVLIKVSQWSLRVATVSSSRLCIPFIYNILNLPLDIRKALVRPSNKFPRPVCLE